ncbi:gasdermin-A isoform X2 [Anolis carolinensis]|uniref:gasdermin-A isoform X2 n=1 Tax=Anolis carolinensis TaxID=28377 RepID=UPI002F2B35C5
MPGLPQQNGGCLTHCHQRFILGLIGQNYLPEMSFHKTTKSLAKKLNPEGDLIPVRSIIDNDHYRPLCLLYRKANSSWWKTKSFRKSEYKLTDVLCFGDHAIKLDVKDGGQFDIEDRVDGTLQGEFSGRDIAPIEAKTNSIITHVMSVKVKKIQLCPTILNSVKKVKINMDHEFIKQSKKHDYNLYIVTEAIEAVEEAHFEESSEMEGSIFYEAYVKMGLKGSSKSKKAIHIPKSCILAFRAKKLQVAKESLGISYYSDEKSGTWFSSGIKTVRIKPEPETCTLSSKENMWMEVQVECEQFSFLSAKLRGLFLSGFVAVMRNKDLLQKLAFQLEEALQVSGQCKLKADEPELQNLVENLQDCSGVIITELAEAVVYFLEALDELQEQQLMLLEESVGKNIVSMQLELVENILGNILSNDKMKFTADAQLLPKEEMIITGAMIEMSGVTIQKNEAHLTGTGEPEALVPLYVVLYVLNLLTQKTT